MRLRVVAIVAGVAGVAMFATVVLVSRELGWVVDLLADELRDVAERTLQPAHTSLWVDEGASP